MIDLRALARRLTGTQPGGQSGPSRRAAWDTGQASFAARVRGLVDHLRAERPTALTPVTAFLAALALLLVGYMFLGRGFAHLGRPPLYVGELVLVIGLVATAFAVVRSRVHLTPLPITWLLIGFMIIGAARTLPYLGTYGFDALRDAVLWGYATFALMIYLLFDRWLSSGAVRLYGWVVPVFALWLPISYYVFLGLGAEIDPASLGSDVPLVFFKSGDMAVHITGSIAFLVLVMGAVASVGGFIWRALLAFPLLWIAFVAGATNRGGLLAFVAGLGAIAILATLVRRSRNWLPVIVAPALLALILVAQGVMSGSGAAAPSASAVLSGSATASPSPRTTASATPTATEAAPAARSLVANPGFELGTLNRGTIESWTTGAGLYNLVRGDAHSGENYASVENTGDPWTATIVSTEFPFRAGDDISVSAWVKAIEGSPALAVYVNWLDGTGVRISSVGMTGLETAGSTSWQEATGVLTAPAGTANAQVQLFERAGGATIGIDEVIVEAGDFIVLPPVPEGRPVTIAQILENITSIFTDVSDEGLEGTERFRIRWWTAIVSYTVFGEHFWTGKGFGVNLADADGFQANRDGSLRAPHNSHMTVLARMGVPGFVVWMLVQGAFGIGLLRSVVTNRRLGETNLAVAAAWILAYWVAMMVNTSFDPYLEGPQGGIWFWSLFGLGMVVMRLTPARAET